MAVEDIRIANLRDDLSFGSRIWGVTREVLKQQEVRDKIVQTFEQRGLLVFEDVEQSGEMQLAISDVFGPLKEHPVKTVVRSSEGLTPGVIDLKSNKDDDPAIVEVDGKVLHNWLPWHFDHAYNNELNRAGVLRPVIIAPSGGLTGFADGIELYKTLPPDLRNRIEGLKVLYTLDLLFEHMRFGKPDNLREIRTSVAAVEVSEMAKNQPRALHPAVWTRKSGEKVLHVSGWHSVGLEGHENPEGDALLKRVCEEIMHSRTVYYHSWKPTQMLIWDNWRMLHCVTGTDPDNPRRMHRTTIKGDYGLGSFEGGRTGGKILERTY